MLKIEKLWVSISSVQCSSPNLLRLNQVDNFQLIWLIWAVIKFLNENAADQSRRVFQCDGAFSIPGAAKLFEKPSLFIITLIS